MTALLIAAVAVAAFILGVEIGLAWAVVRFRRTPPSELQQPDYPPTRRPHRGKW